MTPRVEQTPGAQIEEAEKRLFDLAEKGQFGTGFQSFEMAVTSAIDLASAAYKRDGHLSGLATGLDDLDRLMGGLQGSDLIIVAVPPGHGQVGAGHQCRLQHRQGVAGRIAARRLDEDGRWRHRRPVLAGNVGRAARHPYHRRAVRRVLGQYPPRPHRREPISRRIVEASREMQRIPFYIDQTGGLSIAQLAARAPPAQAPARPRPADRRLYPAPRRHLAALLGEPRAGDHRDHHDAEGARQGTAGADPRFVAALPPGGAARRQAASACRSP